MALASGTCNLYIGGLEESQLDYFASVGTLPENQGWIYRDPDNPPSQPEILNGKLHQGPNADNVRQDWQAFVNDLGDLTVDPLTIEFRLKSLGSDRFIIGGPPAAWRDGWWLKIVDKNNRGFLLGISDNFVDLSNDLGPPNDAAELGNSITPVNIITTDRFHDYRLEVEGGIATLLIDKEVVGSLAIGGIYSSQPSNVVEFGDRSRLVSSETLLVSFQTTAIATNVISGGVNLYTLGKENLQNSTPLDLITFGFIPPPTPQFNSMRLYILGLDDSVSVLDEKFVDRFIRTNDFIPNLVGEFDTDPASVTIEIWDITNGINTSLTLMSNTVNQIGDTNSWYWPMSNMPNNKMWNGYFLFKMTADTGETIVREIEIITISDGRWKYR